MTANLVERIAAHREDRGAAFCRRWGLRRLVLIEPHETIEAAITREKRLKDWHRVWKLRLIAEQNPEWLDLWNTINA